MTLHPYAYPFIEFLKTEQIKVSAPLDLLAFMLEFCVGWQLSPEGERYIALAFSQVLDEGLSDCLQKLAKSRGQSARDAERWLSGLS